MMTEPTAATESAVVRSGMAANADAPIRPEKDPMAAEPVGHSANPTASGAVGHHFPLGRWTMFRNPFSKSSKPANPPRGAVQGELGLDLVKPVRNDLTDSDLLVVAGRSVSASGAGAGADVEVAGQATEPLPVSIPEEKAAAEPVWSRLKTQFFGAEKE